MIIRYTVADEEGNEMFEDYVWDEDQKAQADDFARTNRLCLVASKYLYSDSEVVANYTEGEK